MRKLCSLMPLICYNPYIYCLTRNAVSPPHTHTGSPSTKKTCNHSLEKTSKNLHKCKFSKSSGINSKRTCLLLSSETLLFCCLWAKDQSQPMPNYQIFFLKSSLIHRFSKPNATQQQNSLVQLVWREK